MRIAVTYPGDPTDPRVWSGTPAGLIRGLRTAGVDVIPVDVTPPQHLASVWTRVVSGRVRPSAHHLLTVTRRSASYAALISATAARRVPRDVDAVLQIGTGYRVPGRVTATFEDMTVAQALRHAWGELAELPPSVADGRRRLQASVYRAADVCFLATSWAASSVVEDYTVPPEKIGLTGLGVNRRGEPACDKDWTHPRFLFVGNDWHRKNGDAVLQSFGELHEQRPDARLDLVGGGVPSTVHDLPGVVHHGALPMGDPQAQRRLAGLFAQATCLVVPSRLEPAGIVYAEAGSMGIPSIGTTVGGAADMIGDGGLVVDPTDLDALTQAMVRLADHAMAQEAGARARRHAEGLTWEAVGLRVAERLWRAVTDTREAPE